MYMRRLQLWLIGQFSKVVAVIIKNTGHKITHMYIHGYFMLLFDLTPDQADSEGHVSPPTNGYIRLELKFS
jgi:hypothetical protein